jgi:hypothetical protein
MKQYIELEKADDLLTEIVREIDDLRVRVGNPDDEHLLYNVLMKVFKVQDAISDSKVEEAIPASHPESPQPDKDAEINTLKAKLEYTQRKLENAWQELDKRDFETIKQLRSHPTDREVWVDLGDLLYELENYFENLADVDRNEYPNEEMKFRDRIKELSTLLQDREQAEPVRDFIKTDRGADPNRHAERVELTKRFHEEKNLDREQPAPDREKGNDEPGGSADEAGSVASHSCTDGNSIEQ